MQKTYSVASRLSLRAALGAAVFGSALLAAPASATDYVVDSSADTIAADGQLTLREALMAANGNSAVGDAAAGEADGDTITFSVATVTLAGTSLPISDDVTISGAVTVDAANLSRVFTVQTSAATEQITLSGLTLQNGNASGMEGINGGAVLVQSGTDIAMSNVNISNSVSTGAAPNEGGGAIWAAGNVTLDGGTLSNNSVSGMSGNGGAILVTAGGTLDATNTMITANSAMRAGGGIENNGGVVTLTNVTLSSNTVGPNPGNGGGMHQGGNSSVTITGGTIQGNTAAREGAGLWAAATSVIDGTTITGNTANGLAANQGGGGLFNMGGNMTVMNATITNNTAIASADGAGSGSGGGILNNAGGSLTVSDTTISNNTSNRAGGGIEDNGGTVVLTNVTMDSNNTGAGMGTARPGNGGGVHSGGGTVTVTGGSYTNNMAGREGGGIWTSGTAIIQGEMGTPIMITGNSGLGVAANQGGGGLHNQGGNMTVRFATIDGNFATRRLNADGSDDDDSDTDESDATDTGSGSGGGVLNNTLRDGDGVITSAATLTIENSTISNNVANRAGGGIEDNGGTVTLTNVDMVDNNAGMAPAAFPAPGNGGGLHSGGGMVTMTGGSATGNFAGREGGGLWTSGVAEFTNITVTNNEALGPESNRGGGGLFNQGGDMTVTTSTIDFNVASGTSGSGGGILNNGGTLSVTGGTISNNVSNRAGGGIEDNGRDTATTVNLTNVTMNLNQTGSAPGNGGAIHISGTGNMTVVGSMFDGNIATAEGGALWNSGGMSSMTVNSSTITNNVASGAAADQGGGGLFNDGGTLTVNGSTITDNTADGAAGSGGGILNDGGVLVVNDSTISNNSSIRAGGAIEDDATPVIVDGTAIDDPTTTTLTRVTMDSNTTGGSPGNGGATHVTGPGTITIDLSTVSNNTADNEGGGVWNHNSSTMNIYNSTISGNTSPLGGGVFTQNGSAATVNIINATIASNSDHGIEAAGSNPAASINLTNTIVADNTGGGDVSGAVTANFSLIENVSGASISGGNNVTGVDARLGDLTDNGGPTATHLVTSGPAIDAGNNATCSSAEINRLDQRNVANLRPVDGDADGVADCDIGAVEFADGPAASIDVVADDGEQQNAELGDENVPAISIRYDNDSDENVTLTSIEGRVNGGRLTNVSKVSLLRNGSPIQANVTFNTATGDFVANLTGTQSVAANSSATFTVALSFDSANAGFGLLALAMLGFAMLWRRGRMLVAVVMAGSLSVACSGGSGGDQEDDQSYSVTVDKIVASGDDTMAPVASPALPVTGRTIRLDID